MNHAVKRSNGFTLIELTLAMTFLSFLLVAIAMTVIQISNVYNRGMTLKDVNQAGRSLSNDLQRTIASGAPFAIEPGVGSRYIVQDWGGRLCVGQYSYIWNYGKALNNPSGYTGLNTYAAGNSTQIRFVKVLDANGDYCINPNQSIDPTNAVELLNVGNHTLAVHRFSIVSAPTAIDMTTRERLYTLTFTVGTNDTAALLDDSSACKGPALSGSDLAYCSVQEFNIVVRAGNTVE